MGAPGGYEDDVYGFGCMAFGLAVGSSHPDLLRTVANDPEPEQLRKVALLLTGEDLSAAFCNTVCACLRRSRSARPSAEQLVHMEFMQAARAAAQTRACRGGDLTADGRTSGRGFGIGNGSSSSSAAIGGSNRAGTTHPAAIRLAGQQSRAVEQARAAMSLMLGQLEEAVRAGSMEVRRKVLMCVIKLKSFLAEIMGAAQSGRLDDWLDVMGMQLLDTAKTAHTHIYSV
jgi:hypothetical protein